MEAQLVRLIKSLIEELFSTETSVEVIVETAFKNAETVISDSSKEELVKFIQVKLEEQQITTAL